jgi:hypothetical protein
MKLTLMLADSAQAVGGKLYILGGGWSITNATNITMSIAIKIEVPWDQTNVSHKLKLVLLTEDGQPVTVNDRVCEIQADFEVGRPPGLKPGTPIDVPLAINMSQLNLLPSSHYVWHCSIDDKTDETWRLGFSTRSS